MVTEILTSNTIKHRGIIKMPEIHYDLSWTTVNEASLGR